MTTFSSSSRLANFRQKKSTHLEHPLNIQGELKLTIPAQNDDKSAYQPSSTFHNTRTSLRLLKGRIQRKQSLDKQDLRSTQSNLDSQQRLTLDQKPTGLKLVLNDSPQIAEKKSVPEPPPKAPQKRIIIQKQQPKEESNKQQKKQEPEIIKVEKKKQEAVPFMKQEFRNGFDEKPIIREEDVEESRDQTETQNDLVICPEGCGRKFNRKALEKHAKACKIVFMSKRKQFNSEAKRITSKEQANIVKQKQKEKTQLGKTKGKGFDKTGDNWKAASQDFRAAIKAVKKQDDAENETEGEQDMKLVACEYCEKKFAHVLIEKHHENCVKRKQRENKKRTTKKK